MGNRKHSQHKDHHQHHHNSACGGEHHDLSNHSCISLVPIFNHLENEQMDEIMNATKSLSFKKGEIIYKAGDESDSLYIVSRGRIKIYHLSENGKEQLLRILDPGDFTGELALFKEDVHEAYAEAMVDTNVCTITRQELQGYLIKYPSISLKVLTEFSQRLATSEKQTARVATETVETRIALFLVECVEEGNESLEFKLPMSKKDLASYLGTTPETISRKFADMEGEGLIRQLPQRRIKILDLDGLLIL